MQLDAEMEDCHIQTFDKMKRNSLCKSSTSQRIGEFFLNTMTWPAIFKINTASQLFEIDVSEILGKQSFGGTKLINGFEKSKHLVN